jgi:two-component system NarL family response regulator
MTLRILLVDDHQIFREALRSLLERDRNLTVVGECGDSRDLLRLAGELSPDIVCMDIGLPGDNGVLATRQLLAVYPSIKIIALSTYTDAVYVLDMIYAGAKAYVTKADGGHELLRAIESVARGRQFLSSSVAGVIDRAGISRKPGRGHGPLGERELDVLRLVAQGFHSQDIAAQLQIAVGTVDVHRRNIMRKLDLHSAVDLARYAINAGLIAD